MRDRPWLVVIVFCVVLVLVLGFIKFTQISAAIAFGESFPEPSEVVQLQDVQHTPWQPNMTIVGDVRASQEVELRNELAGVIAEVGFRSGELVGIGQLLVQLDVSEQQAQLEAAKAEEALAAADYKRFSGFKNPDAVSRQQVDRAKAELAIATAQAKSIQSIIDRKTIRAPFKGFASIHQLEVGEYLAPNSIVAYIVGDSSDLWVDFSLPQQHASIKVGTPVQVQADNVSAIPFAAQVIAVEKSLSRESRTVRVRAAFTEKDIPIKPGTIVNVLSPMGSAIQVVRLPSSAVRVDSFGAYVFVVSKAEDGKLRASRNPVEVVAKENEDSIVGSGLELGQRVATKGAFKLREGIWVKDGAEIGNK